MENKKYELVLDDTVQTETGATLYRIRACKYLENVDKGELGGYIENESNLSQEGDAWVFDNARVYENACVTDNAWVRGNACIYGRAILSDDVDVYRDAKIYGDARVFGRCLIGGNATIEKMEDYFVAQMVGSDNGTLTAFVSEKGIEVTRSCFLGTIQEFEEAVIKTHGDSKIGKEYQLLIALIKLKFNE